MSEPFTAIKAYLGPPPKVEYSLTEFGESFIPVLQTMITWNETYLCPDSENPQFIILSILSGGGDFLHFFYFLLSHCLPEEHTVLKFSRQFPRILHP